MIPARATYRALLVCGIAACSHTTTDSPGDGPPTDVASEAVRPDRGDSDAEPREDSGDANITADLDEPPMPRCFFVEPLDQAVIEDTQTPVVLRTDDIEPGSVATLLVDFAPQQTAVVDTEGIAEFPTVPLPSPSPDPIELRGEIRVSFNHRITCAIHVTVK